MNVAVILVNILLHLDTCIYNDSSAILLSNALSKDAEVFGLHMTFSSVPAVINCSTSFKDQLINMHSHKNQTYNAEFILSCCKYPDSNTLGSAFTGEFNHSWSFGIVLVQDDINDTLHILGHELGHLLNASHDEGCSNTYMDSCLEESNITYSNKSIAVVRKFLGNFWSF